MKELNTNFKIGTDEVGRGPLAGPVVACSVLSLDPIKDQDFLLSLNVTDSKKISEKKRTLILSKLGINNISAHKVIQITDTLFYYVQELSAQEIDKINILQASLKAMELTVNNLVTSHNLIDKDGVALIDGNKVPKNLLINGKFLIKGDAKDALIGIASIIAKEYRDNLMKRIHQEFPMYGLDKHAGYPTKSHKEALIEFGPSPYHRKTFKGVKELIK